ncbi:palmitoyltransferase ZDHHC11 [Octopus bimaculoides]|uniref:Palmitoyltransferase n=1 Tax=Octopus bimaculoides TaxID=37653 RepID=A0A0L8GCF9_OCTBM|nr:palmitoyltransferase ZDHHC11 [Octopus bimaculoides]|eukprot:XP_014782575.1 PREDICTED: probable palmitoyltransferase ZDHHC11 [Octopus bimaculoides]
MPFSYASASPTERTLLTGHSEQHGCHRLKNCRQAVLWISVLWIFFVYFSAVLPLFPTKTTVGLGTVTSLMSLLFLTTFFVTKLTDPVDPVSRIGSSMPNGEPVESSALLKVAIKYDEDLRYCAKCGTYVCGSSYHCPICQKCVLLFDHHCIWLNNCIGSRNYACFILSSSSAFILSATVFTSTLVIMSERIHSILLVGWWKFMCRYATERNSLPTFEILFIRCRPDVWLALVCATEILVFVIMILLLCLIVFHFYLMCHNTTTLEYIRQTRNYPVRALWDT